MRSSRSATSRSAASSATSVRSWSRAPDSASHATYTSARAARARDGSLLPVLDRAGKHALVELIGCETEVAIEVVRAP